MAKKVYLNLLRRATILRVSSNVKIMLKVGYNTIEEDIAKLQPSVLQETDLDPEKFGEVKSAPKPNMHITENTPEDVEVENEKKRVAAEKAKTDAAEKAKTDAEDLAAKAVADALKKEKEKSDEDPEEKIEDESDKAEESLTETIDKFTDKDELEEFGRKLGVELDRRKSLKNMKIALQEKLEI